MLKVTRKGQQFEAYIGNGFIGSTATGSSPSDALFKLERTASELYKPYVREIHSRLIHWQISYAQLMSGINTGTIVL
jgi:hypothetical protein